MSRQEGISGDAAIRIAMLRAAVGRRVTTHDLVSAVRRDCGIRINATAAGNIAARLHRAGWLDYPDGKHHHTTEAGRDVLRLLT